MGGISGSSDATFQQAQQLLAEQQRVGMQSAEINAQSGAMQQALRALQAVARAIGG